MTLEAIKYQPSSASSTSSLKIIDQLSLPHRTIYLPIPDASTAHAAIKQMSVRGAPAIAIVAALSVAVEVDALQSALSDAQNGANAAEGFRKLIEAKLEYLLTSRPTAVNLKDAVVKLEAIVKEAAAVKEASAEDVRKAYIQAAEKMLVDDVNDNEKIGEEGARWIDGLVAKRGLVAGGATSSRKVSVLTHCNTG